MRREEEGVEYRDERGVNSSSSREGRKERSKTLSRLNK